MYFLRLIWWHKNLSQNLRNGGRWMGTDRVKKIEWGRLAPLKLYGKASEAHHRTQTIVLLDGLYAK